MLKTAPTTSQLSGTVTAAACCTPHFWLAHSDNLCHLGAVKHGTSALRTRERRPVGGIGCQLSKLSEPATDCTLDAAEALVLAGAQPSVCFHHMYMHGVLQAGRRISSAGLSVETA